MRPLGLVALSLLVACSGDSQITADDFVARYPEAYCAYVFRCCDAIERSYGSTVNCQQAVGDAVNELLAFRAEATSFATFLAAPAQSCLDRLKQSSCKADAALIKGCAGEAVQSNHKPGEECTFSAECTSFFCVQPQKHTKGSCGQPGNAQCSDDDRACPTGNYCDLQTKQCVLQLDITRPCDRAAQCLSGICASSTHTCSARTEPFCDG
jgi:hypothetical protein